MPRGPRVPRHPSGESMPGLPARVAELRGHLIAVVAVAPDGDGDYEIAPFSNRCGIAREWCLAAPRAAVRVAYFGPDPDDGSPGAQGAATSDGTSFAAPMVTAWRSGTPTARSRIRKALGRHAFQHSRPGRQPPAGGRFQRSLLRGKRRQRRRILRNVRRLEQILPSGRQVRPLLPRRARRREWPPASSGSSGSRAGNSETLVNKRHSLYM